MLTGENDCILYGNRFTALPSAVPFRPALLTPIPRIDGVLTAVVTGISGEKYFVDEHGRIKIKFPFLDVPADENASGWVRVATPPGKLNEGYLQQVDANSAPDYEVPVFSTQAMNVIGAFGGSGVGGVRVASHIPRVGTEVLVTFVRGDPSQPLVVGSLYNGIDRPPLQLPDNKPEQNYEIY